MKFKTLALAALAAVAAPSFANIVTHDATELGGSEFVLLVTKAGGSYAQDLGITVKDLKNLLTTTGSFTQAVSSSQWAIFNAYAGDNAKWAIISVQAIDLGLAPYETNFWTTRGVNQQLGTASNFAMNDAVGALGLHFDDIDNRANNTGIGQANNAVASPNTVVSYSDPQIVALNANGFETKNVIGQQTTMVHLTPSSDNADNPALAWTLTNGQGNAYSVNFDGTNVTITAAIPEPSTYAMLFAGLMAVGFVARRRAK